MSDNAAEIAELDADIAQIERVLNAGASQATIGGELVRYDLNFLAQRLQDLQRRRAKLESPDATTFDPFTPIDMSGAA